MFLSCLSVHGRTGETGRACRSSILDFRCLGTTYRTCDRRSDLLRMIETLVLAPLHMVGVTTQRQWVSANTSSNLSLNWSCESLVFSHVMLSLPCI